MVVVPSDDAAEVIRISCRLLGTIIVIDIDKDSKAENSADLIGAIVTMDELRDLAVHLRVVVGQALGWQL
jgi:hypothetical protein